MPFPYCPPNRSSAIPTTLRSSTGIAGGRLESTYKRGSLELIVVLEETQIREFSGRKFTKDELGLIKEVTATYTRLSQAELANTVCELIGWTQLNGKPKTVQCMQFLRRLAEDGELELPALNERIGAGRRNTGENTERDLSWIDKSEMRECGSIRLEVTRPGEGLRRWRDYISAYHRLGDPNVYGNQLRYTIKTVNGRDLGCMLFSASSWTLMPREEWIGWSQTDRKSRLHLVVNNSRFLILPWIRIQNLASRVLSMAARQIQTDWLEDYCYAPVLLETFVDSSLFKGTCYKAANWTYIGETQGRGRLDRYREVSLTRKAIFLYPLQRDFRQILKGDKPFRAAEPHI